MECDKKPLTTIKTELVGVDGKPFTVVQRKLRCLEEQDAVDLSGYRPSTWNADRIRVFLARKGVESIEQLGDEDYRELEVFSRTPGTEIGTKEGITLMLYRVCFSMGGKVEGSEWGGTLGLGEGWTLKEEITPKALAGQLTSEQLIDLANKAQKLTTLGSDLAKKSEGPSSGS